MSFRSNRFLPRMPAPGHGGAARHCAHHPYIISKFINIDDERTTYRRRGASGVGGIRSVRSTKFRTIAGPADSDAFFSFSLSLCVVHPDIHTVCLLLYLFFNTKPMYPGVLPSQVKYFRPRCEEDESSSGSVGLG